MPPCDLIERRHVGGLGVVDLQILGAQRRELLDVLLRGEVRLLARGQLFLRRDDDDVVLLALVEALGAQHDVQRLVPRHVLQAQRHVAADRIADHDVLAAGIRQQLQHGARLDVLEVQRQALAGVLRLVVLAPRRPCAAAAPRRRTDRRTGRRAARSRPSALMAMRVPLPTRVASKRADRRAEVAGVVAAHEVLRADRRPKSTTIWLPTWRRLMWVCGSVRLHDHAAGAIGAAAEVDAADGALSRAPSRSPTRGRRHRRWRQLRWPRRPVGARRA